MRIALKRLHRKGHLTGTAFFNAEYAGIRGAGTRTTNILSLLSFDFVLAFAGFRRELRDLSVPRRPRR
jgi:hypothetical protein